MTTINLPRATVQQALEAWQTATYGHPSHHKATLLAMTALSTAVAQQDEPVEPVPERASPCRLTECAGKPMCPFCVRRKARNNGMPGDPDERYLRRLLAVRVGMPHTYYDDGEAQGQEHGIVIDFMREPVAHIDAKLRALNVARAECLKPPNAPPQRDALLQALQTLVHVCQRMDLEHQAERPSEAEYQAASQAAQAAIQAVEGAA